MDNRTADLESHCTNQNFHAAKQGVGRTLLVWTTQPKQYIEVQSEWYDQIHSQHAERPLSPRHTITPNTSTHTGTKFRLCCFFPQLHPSDRTCLRYNHQQIQIHSFKRKQRKVGEHWWVCWMVVAEGGGRETCLLIEFDPCVLPRHGAVDVRYTLCLSSVSFLTLFWIHRALNNRVT